MWIQIDAKALNTVIAALNVTNNQELAKKLKEKTDEPRNAHLYRSAADDKLCRDGEVEVDEDAVVSKGEDDGAYVQAWLWVSDELAGINEGTEDDEIGLG